MKKISEMNLDELRDHALLLESEKKTLADDLQTEKRDNEELRATNLMLQRRNNELFMRVEQTAIATPTATPEDPEDEVITLEDFAKNNFKEIMKK